MTIWNVLSPIYSYVEAVPDCYGNGPRYDVRDWLVVEAPNKSIAKAGAVRHWIRTDAKYFESGENPYSGVTVNEVTDPESLEDPAEAYGDLFLTAEQAERERQQSETRRVNAYLQEAQA